VPVIFPRWTLKVPLLLAVGIPTVAVLVVCAAWYYGSPWYTDVGYQPVQPVPYSHKLHAGDLGIDCRYCHNTVEVAAWAALPPTQTCMNCHAIVLKDSPNLALVRESLASGNPIPWVRVHKVPDFTFFDHSAHVTAGVGCVTCHGRLDQMPALRQEKPLSMGWCLDCHRDPTPNLRPLSEVTNMAWVRPASGEIVSPRPVHPPTYCSGCHR